MTELERLLTQSLTKMEQELTATQTAQAQMLKQHKAEIQALQANLSTLQQKYNAQTAIQNGHLQRLSTVYENLQPLLGKLNSMLLKK